MPTTTYRPTRRRQPSLKAENLPETKDLDITQLIGAFNRATHGSPQLRTLKDKQRKYVTAKTPAVYPDRQGWLAEQILRFFSADTQMATLDLVQLGWEVVTALDSSHQPTAAALIQLLLEKTENFTETLEWYHYYRGYRSNQDPLSQLIHSRLTALATTPKDQQVVEALN